jgi:putative addiction module component (TIGR02574 family)
MDGCTMANDVSQNLLNDAMQLPAEQRAALAAALIESLDPDVDEEAEAAWSVEIARRLREVEGGQVKTIPWSQARQIIAADDQRGWDRHGLLGDERHGSLLRDRPGAAGGLEQHLGSDGPRRPNPLLDCRRRPIG